MAKQKDKGLIRHKALEDSYIKITELNRKMAICLGRLIHVVQYKNPTYYEQTGLWDVRPRLEAKTWLKMNHYPGVSEWECFVFNEEDPLDYRDQFSALLKHGIENEIFYIKKNQKLVTYTKSKERTIEKTV